MGGETCGDLFARLQGASGLDLSLVEGEVFLAISRAPGPPPPALTAFLELSAWVGSSLRSGVWTYYEAADPGRLQAVLDYLRDNMDPGLARVYASGIHDYQGRSLGDYPEAWLEEAEIIDGWIWAHENAIYEALRNLLLDHAPSFLSPQITE